MNIRHQTTEESVELSIDKSQVMRSFDVASQAYNHFTSLQRQIGRKLVVLAQELRLTPTRVIDIGSGTGFMSAQLQQHYPACKTLALDLSLGMLQHSRLLSGANGSAIHVCGDAESLPVSAEVFDAVYSNLAFQWCPDLRKTFSECQRVLNKGGLLAFSTFGPDTLKELRDAWAAADEAVHVNSFVDIETIENLLKANGFEIHSLYAENVVLHYDDSKAVMRGVKGMGAHNINPGRHKGMTGVGRFKKVQARYEAMREEQGLPATYQAIYGVCVKR
jgi:malonyl-CoA O-methyltransferase